MGQLQVVVKLGVVCAAFFAAPVIAQKMQADPHALWVLCLGLGAVGLIVLGRTTQRGLLVNEHERWSLSRFQLVGWTWLLLPTFWCVIVLRWSAQADPLNLPVDQGIWLLLGINATSFTGATLIDKQMSDRNAAMPPRSGPGACDLFMGTTPRTADLVDISRVQMWFFTSVTMIGYSFSIWRMLSQPGAELVLPTISDGMNTMLAISHATYLANKLTKLDAGGARVAIGSYAVAGPVIAVAPSAVADAALAAAPAPSAPVIAPVVAPSAPASGAAAAVPVLSAPAAGVAVPVPVLSAPAAPALAAPAPSASPPFASP